MSHSADGVMEERLQDPYVLTRYLKVENISSRNNWARKYQSENFSQIESLQLVAKILVMFLSCFWNYERTRESQNMQIWG